MREQLASRQITAHLPAADVIEFSIPVQSKIRLTILDENGKTVQQVLDGQPFEAGTHEIHFESAKYCNGLFYYRLSAMTEAGEIVDTKRIVLPDNLH